MVTKITTVKHICDFRRCGLLHKTEDEAKKCEAKGLTGVIIEPGLIFKEHKFSEPERWIIVEHENHTPHERMYAAFKIDVSTYETGHYYLHASKVENSLSMGYISLLTEKEFKEFIKLVSREEVPEDPEVSEPVRKLRYYAGHLDVKVTDLYRRHAYFEEKIAEAKKRRKKRGD